MRAMRRRSRRQAREGFAIPVAILVIVVVSMLALGGVYVALGNLASDTAVRRSWKALYAADAGAARVVATWDRTAYGALNPGDSVDTGWRPLPDGSSYRTIVLRVDAGAAGTPALYRLRTIGRPAQGATAQRVVLTMASGNTPGSVCCAGAMRVQGRLQLQAPSPINNVKAEGADFAPPLWGAQCPPAGPDVAGVSARDASDVQYLANGIADGSPPIAPDPSIDNASFTDFGVITYADLAAAADKTFIGNQSFSGIFPVSAGGQCTTALSTNWGDPLNPASPCFAYLPVIHVAGDLTISGAGFGQGIVLVDGDLDVSGTFEFYGVMIVLGKAEWSGSARLVGGALVRNRLNGAGITRVRQDAKVQYSGCAVSRALAKLATVRPLAGRHWFEVLQ